MDGAVRFAPRPNSPVDHPPIGFGRTAQGGGAGDEEVTQFIWEALLNWSPRRITLCRGQDVRDDPGSHSPCGNRLLKGFAKRSQGHDDVVLGERESKGHYGCDPWRQMNKGHWVLAKASHGTIAANSRSKPLSTAAFSRREARGRQKGQICPATTLRTAVCIATAPSRVDSCSRG